MLAKKLHDLAERAFAQADRLRLLCGELEAKRADPVLSRLAGKGWQLGCGLATHVTMVAINLHLNDGAAELAKGLATTKALARIEARAIAALGGS